MSDKMREEFEAWAVENGFDVSHNGHHYNSGNTYYAWKSWQASRAALVVNITVHEEFDKRMYASNVYKELDSAGVRYE